MSNKISFHGGFGVHAPRAKFTEDQVKDIRERHIDGEKVQVIADHFNVNQSTIYNIIAGRTYPDKTYSALGRNFQRMREEWTKKNASVSQAEAQ
tara:strand:- start:47 stop:328 length:282 start_codon:yes stop_codon:yes gene_type:complete